MIIGRNFAYAHLPKTGGDSAAIYFSALTDCAFDHHSHPRKHDSFFWRKDSVGKEYLLVGIRALPTWTWSWMNEISHRELHDFSGLGFSVEAVKRKILSVDFALSRPWGDMFLMSIICGVKVTHWIRSEYLFNDILAFVHNNVNEVNEEKAHEVSLLRTKVRHDRPHPFIRDQVKKIYEMNPHWAEVEQRVYAR
jgi:hypothetical protein